MPPEDLYDLVREMVRKVNQLEHVKQRLANWDKVFQFNPSDSDPFYVSVKRGAIEVTKGSHQDPEAILEASSNDLMAIIKGEMDGIKAFFAGKLKVKGNVFSVQDFYSILKEVKA